VDPPALGRQRLFDLDFVNERDIRRVAVDIATATRIDDGDLPLVVTPNVDQIVQLQSAPAEVRRLVERAHWCLPDGQPIVWSSRVLRRPLAARLPGSTLVRTMWTDPDLSRLSWAIVASSESLQLAIDSAGRRIRVVTAPALTDGAIPPFVRSHIGEIADANPRLVFVCLGYPKDVLLISELMERWPPDVESPVFLAVGASFDLLLGLKKRAPDWVQRIGMEWFFRFMQEPRRLFVRYFVRDPTFAVIVLREARSRT
jgi:N-acetylglucosaminyldiphosphoundecaprenol N-acetyl-beta-D-mannosaminyltransferase